MSTFLQEVLGFISIAQDAFDHEFCKTEHTTFGLEVLVPVKEFKVFCELVLGRINHRPTLQGYKEDPELGLCVHLLYEEL